MEVNAATTKRMQARSPHGGTNWNFRPLHQRWKRGPSVLKVSMDGHFVLLPWAPGPSAAFPDQTHPHQRFPIQSRVGET